MFSLSMIIEKLSVKKMLKVEFYARCVYVVTTLQITILLFFKKILKYYGTPYFIAQKKSNKYEK